MTGSFTCHCGDTGVERTPNSSQHTKMSLEEKILLPLLPGFELATFRSRVRRSNQQAIHVHTINMLSYAWGDRHARVGVRRLFHILQGLYYTIFIVRAFSSLQGPWESVRQLIPHLCFFLFFFKVEIILNTLIPLFYTRISPQWLSELR